MDDNSRLHYKLGRLDRDKIYGPKNVRYIYDTRQAAIFCEVTAQTIKHWVTNGQLPAFKVCIDESIPAEISQNGKLYFLKEDLENALRISLGVPTEGFNVEDHIRDRYIH